MLGAITYFAVPAPKTGSLILHYKIKQIII
jgi:hypothetical protein